MAVKEVTIQINAKDAASQVFAKARQNFQAEAGKITGPSTIQRQMSTSVRARGFEEQAVRDELASRTKIEREKVRKEHVQFVADERQFGVQLAQEMRRTRQNAEKEQLSGLDRLKNVLGKRGPLGQVSQLLMGGGAIAAVGFITSHFANAARNARELVDQFRDGTISAGEMHEQLIGTVPVLGAIWRAGRDIREMITGEAAALREVRREVGVLEQAMQARLDLQKQTTEAHKVSLKVIQDINREMTLRFLPEPQKLQVAAGSSAEDQRKAAEDRAQKRRDELTEIEKVTKLLTDERSRQQAIMQSITPDMLAKDMLGTSRGPFYAAEKAIKELDAKLKVQAEKSKGGLVEIEKDKADEIKAIDRNLFMERLKNLKDFGRKFLDKSIELAGENATNIKAQHRNLSQIESDNRAGELLAQRRSLDAELEQIREATRQKIKAAGAEPGSLELRQKTQFAIAASGRQQEEKAIREDANRRGEVESRIAGIKADVEAGALEQQAKAGDRLAKLDLERLRIAEKYRGEREEINRLLRDENLTLEQRRDLEQAKARLGVVERKELERVGREAIKVELKLPEAIEGRLLSGLGQAAKERMGVDPMVAEQRQTNVNTRETAKHTRDLLTATKELIAKIAAGGAGTVLTLP